MNYPFLCKAVITADLQSAGIFPVFKDKLNSILSGLQMSARSS